MRHGRVLAAGGAITQQIDRSSASRGADCDVYIRVVTAERRIRWRSGIGRHPVWSGLPTLANNLAQDCRPVNRPPARPPACSPAAAATADRVERSRRRPRRHGGERAQFIGGVHPRSRHASTKTTRAHKRTFGSKPEQNTRDWSTRRSQKSD